MYQKTGLRTITDIEGPASRLGTADDEMLAERVELAVRRETIGAVHDLEVAVDGDEISLHGQCPSFYCKQLAQHAAMILAEARTVNNQIEVA